MKKLFFLSMLVLAACTKSSDDNDFIHSRNRWEAKSVSSYEFTLTTGCFCPAEVVGPHRIKVVNNQIVTVDDKAYDPTVNGTLMTIDELFSFISRSLEQEPWKKTVEYNFLWGYPEKVYFDFYKLAVDEEIGYTITDFKVN